MFMSSLSSLLLSISTEGLQFESILNPTLINYGLFSTFSRSAHCDPEYLQYTLTSKASGSATSCGMACKQLMQYTAAAQFDEIKYYLNKVDHTQYITFKTNHSFALSASVDATTIVAFRGTVGFDTLNFRRNLLFKFAPTTICSMCTLHQGFWRNFLSLRPSLAASIAGLSDSVFTGMSMGAPLATLATTLAFEMATSFSTKGCVTFGMPRVANAELSKYVITQITSGVGLVGFAYGRDPVPHVPPRIFGYRSTQAKLFHVILDPGHSVKSLLPETDGDGYDVAMLVQKLYLNEGTTCTGDKMFAAQFSSMSMMDHMKYFTFEGAHGCGFDHSDKFLASATAAELFFL